MLRFQSPPSTISQSSGWTEPPSPLRCSQRDPYGERCPSPEPTQVPGRQARFQAPQQGPQGEWCPSPEPSDRIFPDPRQRNPLQVPLTELPRRKLLPFRSPHSLPLKIPSKRSPAGSPPETLRIETPVSRPFFYPSPNNSPFPQSPRKMRPPSMLPKRVTMERGAPSPELMVIHSFISGRDPSKGALPRKREKHTVTVRGAPRGRKAYIQWGAAWFPKGIV